MVADRVVHLDYARSRTPSVTLAPNTPPLQFSLTQARAEPVSVVGALHASSEVPQPFRSFPDAGRHWPAVARWGGAACGSAAFSPGGQ